MKKITLLFASLAWLCVGLFVAVQGSFAQSYPNKPIRIIVPFSPGGPPDTRARMVAAKLTESWGQQVVVENMPGADGAIGMEKGAKAAPGGYTLILTTISTGAINPSFYKTVHYDPVKDFTPIIQLSSSPYLLLVRASLPVKSVKELIELARAKPGQLNYGSGSSALYLAQERFNLRTGINIAKIPFKGAAPATLALLSGEVDMMLDNPLTEIPHLKAGKLRAIAIFSPKRSPILPDVPTMSESGFPGLEAGSWAGVLAPAGTPKQIVRKLNTEIVRILHMPAIKNQLENVGGDQIVAGTPKEFGAHIKSELEKYAKVIRDAKIPRL